MEAYALDRLVRWHWSGQSDRIILISIDDDDYEQLFGGKSPLCPGLIVSAIESIKKTNPAVIGVDVDTSAQEYKGYKEAMSTFRDRVVWARNTVEAPPPKDAVPSPAAGRQDHESIVAPAEAVTRDPVTLNWTTSWLGYRWIGHHHSLHVRLAGLLGGSFRQKIDQGRVVTDPVSGVALLPADADHIVRGYVRTFGVAADGAQGAPYRIESFPWAIAQQYRKLLLERPRQPVGALGRLAGRLKSTLESSPEEEDEDESPTFRFSFNPYRFRTIKLSDFLAHQQAHVFPEKGSLFDGRIVLLGGQFSASRDAHFTPVGKRSGLELTAEAVDAELTGNFIGESTLVVALVLDLFAGMALVWIDWRLRESWWAIYAMAALIFVMSIVCSLIAFNTTAYWFNFTAVLVGVWIHLLWDGAHAKRELHKRESHKHLEEK